MSEKKLINLSIPYFWVQETIHSLGKLTMRKSKVVVDIRGLNKITENDVFPIFFQTDIISAIQGAKYFLMVDCAGFPHQWPVKFFDRHKLTVLNHRGNEQWNVAYIQRQINGF